MTKSGDKQCWSTADCLSRGYFQVYRSTAAARGRFFRWRVNALVRAQNEEYSRQAAELERLLQLLHDILCELGHQEANSLLTYHCVEGDADSCSEHLPSGNALFPGLQTGGPADRETLQVLQAAIDRRPLKWNRGTAAIAQGLLDQAVEEKRKRAEERTRLERRLEEIRWKAEGHDLACADKQAECSTAAITNGSLESASGIGCYQENGVSRLSLTGLAMLQARVAAEEGRLAQRCERMQVDLEATLKERFLPEGQVEALRIELRAMPPEVRCKRLSIETIKARKEVALLGPVLELATKGAALQCQVAVLEGLGKQERSQLLLSRKADMAAALRNGEARRKQAARELAALQVQLASAVRALEEQLGQPFEWGRTVSTADPSQIATAGEDGASARELWCSANGSRKGCLTGTVAFTPNDVADLPMCKQGGLQKENRGPIPGAKLVPSIKRPMHQEPRSQEGRVAKVLDFTSAISESKIPRFVQMERKRDPLKGLPENPSTNLDFSPCGTSAPSGH